MSDVIGRGVIEMSADSTKLTAGIADAKKSIKSLGKEIGDSVAAGSTRAQRSIDNYVKKLQTAASTNGLSARESELYTLSLRGASKAQLEAADSALRMNESYRQGVERSKEVADSHQRLKSGFIALGAAAAAAAVATAAGTIALINQVGNYQDLSEKIGDTAVAVSSLKSASDVSGTSIDTIAAASVKLTAALSKTDDESKSVGAAIAALGIDFDKFKAQSPVEQLQTVSRAFGEFADGSEKTAVAVSLFGKSGAELLGFLKEYADEGLNAAYVTQEQVKAADDYSDASAKMRSQFAQFLQLSALQTIPVLTQVGDLFKGVSAAQDGASSSTDLIKAAIGGLVVVFQTIAVVGSDVVFTFKMVGQEIGAISAQLAALARLDFNGFTAISDAVTEDAARARKELDKFQERVMAVGKASSTFADPRILGNPGTIADQAAAMRPKLNTSGLNQDKTPKAKKDNTAAGEAKAQLALDLDEIRKAQEALSNTIANGDKIIEANRNASLISEADYFAEKRRNLLQNNAAQESGAQQEIARLKAEKLTGKDRIENAQKIADAEAKLAKLRENGATSVAVLDIRSDGYVKGLANAYEDAREAAQSYLDVANRARQQEVDGLGMGQQARDRSAALAQIADKYEQQRQELQRDNRNGKFVGRQDAYDQELALINQFQAKSIASYGNYYDQLKARQASFSLGASEALRDYYDESRNVFSQTQGAVRNAFQGMEDVLVEFATTGKLNFKSLANSIIADLARIAIKQSITGPLANALGSVFGGGGYSKSDQAGLDGLVSSLIKKNANGGVYSSPGLSAYSGQVISKPTIFPFARGAGLMGEAGPEAILPLRRGADGKLGVAAGGGGGGGVEVHVHNNGAPATAQVKQSQMPDGGIRIDVMLEQIKDAIADDISSGSGSVSRSMEGRYGLRTAVN